MENVFEYYDSVREQEVEWLWYPYIPYGKLTLLEGDPGEGKSTLMIQIASLLTNGKKMPDDVLKIRGIFRKDGSAAILLFYLDEAYLDYLNEIKAADIERDAVYVNNPIMNELPSRSAVMCEVEELLLSM